MPRARRLIVKDETAVYHIMSRTALDGFPLGDIEKDFMLKTIRRFSTLYFVEILGFCIMGNHFHILVRMFPEHEYTDEEIQRRYESFYGDEIMFADGWIPGLRMKLSSLSEFIKDIKQTFSRFYNKRHNRRGTLWGERFKSLIVEKGETLINCLAYIDLNPVRAALVERPKDYRWNSLGYHIQTGNRDSFLSTDFGLREFNVKSEEERVIAYRRYVYEAGALERADKRTAKANEKNIVANERQKNYEIKRMERFRYRTRYFTDSGIIGTKKYVSRNYQKFKNLFMSKREKIPKPISGLDGVYSLKRLSES